MKTIGKYLEKCIISMNGNAGKCCLEAYIMSSFSSLTIYFHFKSEAIPTLVNT